MHTLREGLAFLLDEDGGAILLLLIVVALFIGASITCPLLFAALWPDLQP
jgi:hypothetical protein